MATVLVTGAAGFIGFHLALRLLEKGETVVAIDNLNDYYDVSLKRARVAQLARYENFRLHEASLEDGDAVNTVFANSQPEIVVNLAAQAGVRYSLTKPHLYVSSNMTGFLNVLEACRHHAVKHLVYASSSSVYGSNDRMPFSPHDPVNHPLSLYAASKRANELMAHSYSHCFGLPTTGLRFFTVYGPWGRPDMATYLFTSAILENRPIEVFNHGKMRRNFTYVDDAVEGIARVMARPPQINGQWTPGDSPDPASSRAPFRLYNVGSDQPTELLAFIELIEKALGRKAVMKMMGMQTGDVPATFADIEELRADTGYAPQVPIETGIPRFVAWYREYYGV